MIFLGKILKVRGNRGEVVLDPAPETLNEGLPVGIGLVLKSPKYSKKLEIDSYRNIGGSLIVRFLGVNSIEEAFRLVGYSLFWDVKKPQDIPPAENQLVGYRVEDLQGNAWGKIVGIEHHGLNVVFEAVHHGDHYLIPANSAIFRAVMEDEKKVVIDPPDGLRDLNR